MTTENTTTFSKKSAGALLALALILAGGAYGVMSSSGIVSANSNGVEEQEPNLNGSIQVADDESLSEAQAQSEYSALAKISEADAIKIAEAEVGGTAKGAELEAENGSLVYEVEIGNQEVLVDAGTGSVLFIEQDND